MEIEFASFDLQRVAESVDRSNAHLGSSVASLFRQRLCELSAADDLSIVKLLPALSLQPVGQHRLRFSILICSTHKLVFDGLSSGGAQVNELAALTRARIISIEVCNVS